jgi:hypothetical protein
MKTGCPGCGAASSQQSLFKPSLYLRYWLLCTGILHQSAADEPIPLSYFNRLECKSVCENLFRFLLGHTTALKIEYLFRVELSDGSSV